MASEAVEKRIDWRDLPPVPEDERPVLSPGWQPSQTFLKKHDRCDRDAMLYLKYRAGSGGHALNRGAIAHEVFSRLTRFGVEQGEGRIGDPGIGKEVLREVMGENPALQVSAVERDALRYMVSNFCLGEWWDPAKLIGIETSFSLKVGPFTIIGRIDRAEERALDTIGVVDYKTSFNMVDPDEFKAESFDEEGKPRFAGDFQTMIYALGLAEGTLEDGMPLGDGYERFEIELVYPRYLRPEGLARRKATVTRLQLLDFKLDVEDQLRRIVEVNFGQGKWQPTPGSHCSECTAANLCPLPRVLRAESQFTNMTTLAELEEAGADWLFQTKRSAAVKSRIKKAAERIADADEGLLELPDGQRGIYIGTDLALIFKPTEKETIKDKGVLAEAVEAAVKYGTHFDMAEHVRFSEGVSFEKRKVAPRRQNGDTDE